MSIQQKKALIAYLLPQITENKASVMAEALQHRTRHVTILLEDIFQQHNASAAVRSAECFGLQDMHVVESRFKFAVNCGVAMGSSKWIDLHRHKTTQEAFQKLKNDGYRIIATTPAKGAVELTQLPLEGKLALVFGTENVGLSEYALEHADEYVHIPMFGFTQSFNVSVSAALCVYQLTTALRQSTISWQLSEEEKTDIMLSWLRGTIRGSGEFERMFMREEACPPKPFDTTAATQE